MMKLYRENKLYPLFYDQYLTVTFIDEACRALKYLVDKKKTGIFHCSSRNITTPYKLVNYLIAAKYLKKDAVKKTSIYEFLKNKENKVRYPIFGGLDTKYTENKLGIKFMYWENIVDKLIKQKL